MKLDQFVITFAPTVSHSMKIAMYLQKLTLLNYIGVNGSFNKVERMNFEGGNCNHESNQFNLCKN